MAKKRTGDRELHPENVAWQLQRFHDLVEQDLGSLRVSILNYRRKNNPSKDEATYHHERLMLTREKSGPRFVENELPHILEYCRILGVDAHVVERFVTRLTDGDIGDWDTVRVHGKRCLREIERAIDRAEKQDAEGRATVVRANRSANNSKKIPRSEDVQALCRKLKRELPKGKKQIHIAREYAGGNEKVAQNLMQQARRFPWLWKPEQ